MKTLVAQINPIIGDISGNQKKLLQAIAFAKDNKCALMITPELALTGYPPEDFLLLPSFIKKTEEALIPLIQNSKGLGIVIGTIRTNPGQGKPLLNSAAIIYDGKLLGFQDKTLLPTYDVFDEMRYFEPALANQPWQIGPYKVGITICEDIWQLPHYIHNPIDALGKHSLDIHLNLSASPFHVGKLMTRIEVGVQAAKNVNCPFILCNQVGGNDSLIFDGHSFMINEKRLTHLAKGFSEDLCIMDTASHLEINLIENPLEELHQALLLGLRDYFSKSGFTKACLGLSGGIDSALVACLAVEALGKENVLGVAMPSRYSSKESLTDAEELAKRLQIPLKTIPIEKPFESYLDLLTPHFNNKGYDSTEENLQARIRCIILMALSNKHGYIVLSTGNKSELALGYSTLYGDMSGGLAVISDLTKEQVYLLSHYINKTKNWIPESTLTKPPSAELRPNQKDSDTLPEYPIVDRVLRAYIEMGQSPEEIIQTYQLDPAIVHDLIRKIHANEYKRRQSPIGLRVTEKAFSVGRRFPIVQGWA